MRSTTNILASLVTGSPLPPTQVDDMATILASCDDDALFEMIRLEPPPSVTLYNSAKAYIPLRDGPAVLGDASLRQVTVQPMRVCRSSLSNATPRAMVSACTTLPVVVSMNAAPTVGLWRLDLLYAQITYVDSSNPSKGTQVAFYWVQGTAASTAGTIGVGNIPDVPADSSTYWNVPIKYVRVLYGATNVAQADVLEFTDRSTGMLNYRSRLAQKLAGFDARRSASEDNSVEKLTSGAGGLYSAAAQILLYNKRPSALSGNDADIVMREIVVPGSATGGSGGVVAASAVLDRSRDWRKGSFWMLASFSSFSPTYSGEDLDQAAVVHQFPTELGNGTKQALYISRGQTFEIVSAGINAVYNATGYLRVGSLGPSGADDAPIAGTTYLAAGDYLLFYADAGDSGALKLSRKVAGAAVGGALHIILFGFFPNSR